MYHDKLFRPSAAERWGTCPASVHHNVQSQSSSYALEGVLAHSAAYQLAVKGKVIEQEVLGNSEMMRYVQQYVEYTKEIPGVKHYERKLNYSDIVDDKYTHESTGTADCVVFDPISSQLHIVDFKYGKGIRVNAYKNKQLMLYAWGATRYFSFQPARIHLHIVQPRIDHIDVYTLTYEELRTQMQKLTAATQNALTCNPAYNASEKGCRWCAHLANCEEVSRQYLNAFDSSTKELNDDEKREILDNAALVEAFIKALRADVRTHLQEGQSFPGYKLVNGRTTRKLKQNAQEKLHEILNGKEIETKLKTLTELEKIIGKKEFAKLDITFRAQGKMTLVKDTDPRDAVTTKQSIRDQF